MKIQITVEVSDEKEINMATELLRTLREFTDHVQVSGPGVGQPSSLPSPTGASAAADEVSTSVQPAAVAPAAAPGPAPAPGGQASLQDRFTRQLDVLEDPGAPVAPVLQGVLAIVNEAGGEAKAVQEAFLGAFTEKILDQSKAMHQFDFERHYAVLNGLPSKTGNTIKQSLVSKVLQKLTVDRDVQTAVTKRIEFYAHAEGFAMLLKSGFMKAEGAADVITSLVSKESNRVAAVTMLGKTIHKCFGIITQLPPERLARLEKALGQVTEPELQPDLEYINTNLAPYFRQAAGNPAS